MSVEALALTSALATIAAAASATATVDRDAQWQVEWRNGQAVAVFYSWDHSLAVFTVGCDRKAGNLIVRYNLAAAGYPVKGAPRMYIGNFAMPTRRMGGYLEGRVNRASGIWKLLVGQDELEITARNEMGEPWYVGRAAPLRTLAATCR
ncbi:hypothetical protein [Sandarakinorhabdus rubra]|uniref:hypothetical protein n=1 Tax=Sandarakinorhabdus rubra TaxID=2672568 RepID=UPI0013D99900|nr:hypothetical protein [Sandarakinorhabdus rubra]